MYYATKTCITRQIPESLSFVYARQSRTSPGRLCLVVSSRLRLRDTLSAALARNRDAPPHPRKQGAPQQQQTDTHGATEDSRGSQLDLLNLSSSHAGLFSPSFTAQMMNCRRPASSPRNSKTAPPLLYSSLLSLGSVLFYGRDSSLLGMPFYRRPVVRRPQAPPGSFPAMLPVSNAFLSEGALWGARLFTAAEHVASPTRAHSGAARAPALSSIVFLCASPEPTVLLASSEPKRRLLSLDPRSSFLTRRPPVAGFFYVAFTALQFTWLKIYTSLKGPKRRQPVAREPIRD